LPSDAGHIGPLSIINAVTLLGDAERYFLVVDFERGEP
jgi:hypothetical protein